MSPAQVAEYLRTIRDAGCMSCSLEIDGLKLAVTLGPESLMEGPQFGEVPAPGGWKADTGHLDMPFAEDMSERLPE